MTGMFGSPSARPANSSTRPECSGTCSIGASLIAPRVRGSDHGAVDQFAPEDLHCLPRSVARRRRAGHGGWPLTITVANPINRCPMVVVPVEEVERFGQRYIFLFAFAKQQGRHFLAVKKELEAAGIKPTLGPEMVGATFYRRSDVLVRESRRWPDRRNLLRTGGISQKLCIIKHAR